ncbi:MAG: ATP-grasp domain-containing protein [Acidobacteria bacterium]|nr:ATP-grasp domain-containing protein [Acidobacteriota bacterium]
MLHTLPPDSAGNSRYSWEFDLHSAAANVAKPLENAVVRGVKGHPREILDALRQEQPDVVLNLCEAPLGRPELESHAAALLEWSGVRFTGCGSETLSLCRRKDRTNALLRDAGVAVSQDVDPERPVFPCVVKPAGEDGSAGIDDNSVCHTAQHLHDALHKLAGPAMVQRFLPGREFAVSLWGRHHADHASIGETTFENGLQLITYEAKWNIESASFRNSPMSYRSEIDEELRARILATARSTWEAVGARHCLRIDIRLDETGSPYVIDVNPNPEISPEVGVCRAVQEAGWRWEDFVRSLVEWA